MKTNIHFWSYLAEFILEWEMFQIRVLEKIKTRLVFNSFFFENRAFYGIAWKNTVEPSRPQVTIWCMHIACRITKTTNTHSEYIILIAIPLQQWLHKRASMLRFTNIVSYVAFAFHIAVQQPVAIRSWTIANIICSVPAATNDVAPTGISEYISVYFSSTHLSSSVSYLPINVLVFWNSQI
jgi:hypothetical protein